MKIRTTIALLLVTAAALTYILVEERHEAGTTERARTAHLLATADPTEAWEIKIADAGGEIRIRRNEDGDWTIQKPFQDRADQGAVERLLALVTGLRIVERIPSSLEIAGGDPFGPSAREITLKRDADHKILKILVGKSAPFQDSAYARNLMDGDEEESFVVAAPDLALLGRPVTDLRDPGILPFPAREVTRLQIRSTSGELELARTGATKESEQWWLTRPLRARAHNPTVTDTIAALGTARVRPRPEAADSPPPSASSIKESEGTVFVTVWAGEEGSPLSVWMLPQADGTLLAKIDGRDPVFEVVENVLPALLLAPNSLRDDTLAAIDPKAVNSIIIESVDRPDIPLFRRGERWWTYRNGNEEEANQARVEALIRSVNNHPILEFTSDAATDLAPYGLDNPFLRVTFSGAEVQIDGDRAEIPVTAENSLTLLLGQGERSRVYAKFAAEPFVHTIDPSLLSEISTDPIKWKGTRLTSFSLFDLRRIRVSRDASPPLELSYEIDRNRWTASGPGGDFTSRLNLPLVEAYAAALSSFYVDDWLGDRSRALELLENPTLRIEIDLEREAYAGGERTPETVTLTFCPTNPDGPSLYYYGRRDEMPDVFMINRETYSALTAPLLREEAADQGALAPTPTSSGTPTPSGGP